VPVPTKPRVGYGYYPWVKFRAHTRRVGYPRIPIPTGKIVILIENAATYGTKGDIKLAISVWKVRDFRILGV
jgi:hypothetical protein